MCETSVEHMHVVVVGEIITLYLVQTGCILAAIGYVAQSPNHVQNNVPMSAPHQCLST